MSLVGALIANVLSVAFSVAMLHAHPDLALLYAALIALNSFVAGLLAAVLIERSA